VIPVSRTDVLAAVTLGSEADAAARPPEGDMVLGAVELDDLDGHVVSGNPLTGLLLVEIELPVSLDDGPLPVFRQVAVAVAIHVEGIAIQDNPGAALRLGTQDQQAVRGCLPLIGGFLGNGAVDLG